MTGRNWNWSVGDRVAIRDFTGTPWLLGVITTVTATGLLVIDLGAPTAPTVRYPDDVRVVPADQVPIDERHWVSQDERGRLLRQEAAARVQAMTELLAGDSLLEDLADELDDLTGGFDELRIDAARALITPAREEVPDAEPRLVTSP